MDISADNLYIVVSTVSIISIILILYFCSRRVHEVENDSDAVIKLGSELIDISPKDLVLHLDMLKKYLIKLTSNMTDYNCELNSLLHKAKKDFEFSEPEMIILGIRRDPTCHINELDDEDIKGEFEDKLTSLLKGIDDAVDIVNRKTKRVIVLTNVHKLLHKLYSMREDLISCRDLEQFESEFTYLIKFDEDFSRKSVSAPSLKKNVASSTLSQSLGGFDRFDDGETYANEQDTIVRALRQAKKQHNVDRESISHFIGDSEGVILSGRRCHASAQYCDIDKLRSEMQRKRSQSTDTKFNRSLRNDYDYLEHI